MKTRYLTCIAAMGFVACGPAAEEQDLSCGDGTKQEGAQCVATISPSSAPQVTCGEGTKQEGTVCIGTMTTGVSCGAGTRLSGTQCVPVGPGGLTCGRGTTASGNQCVAAAGVSCGAGTKLSGNQCVAAAGVTCGPGTYQVGAQCLPGQTPSLRKRIFITRTRMTGSLGGVTGADDKCQIAAEAAARGGTWKAWLSTSTVHAIDRIQDVGPWYDISGINVLFHAKAGLRGYPLSYIDSDEYGAPIGGEFWTGTVLMGTAGSSHCSGWTATSGKGLVGLAATTSQAWTQYTFSYCGDSRSLLCIEQ